MPTIVIAAGGTAGHVVPALAVADALRARGARGRVHRRRARRGGARAGRRLPAPSRCACRGIDRQQPAAGRPRRAARGAGDAGGRGGCCGAIGADAVLGGGGYVAGPVGLAARTLRLPLVLTEADSHLGVAEPAARAVRARGSSWPSRSRARRRLEVARDRAAGPGGHRRGRPARPRARASGSPPDEPCVLVFGGSLGARRLNEAALEAFGAGAPVRGAARLRAARLRRPAQAARRARLAAALPALPLTSSRSRTPWPPPTWRWPAPAARCSSSPPPACRRSSCPTRTPPADHQTANARYMEEAGAAVVVPDERARRPAAGARGRPPCSERRSGLAAMAKAARAVARPDAAERIADELLGLVANDKH